MVDAGTAQMVMGNHEFNAISFATADPEADGCFMRPHSKKTVKQHKAFTDQVPVNTRLYAHWIDWFKTLPLWLELDGIRVVHACWSDAEIEVVNRSVPPGTPMSTGFVIAANRKGSPEHEAIEILLKGPELSLTTYGQPGFMANGDHVRTEARIRWWNSEAITLRELAEIPSGSTTEDDKPYPDLPDLECPDEAVYDYHDPTPVFYGHYWRTGEPVEGTDWTGNTVCVDFSAVRGGPLVAYRWNKGSIISFDHYVAHVGTRSGDKPTP